MCNESFVKDSVIEEAKSLNHDTADKKNSIEMYQMQQIVHNTLHSQIIPKVPTQDII